MPRHNQNTLPGKGVAPGAVIAIQTFGDFLNFNPHCHVLCTDGAFFESGAFKVAPAFDTESLEKLFAHNVLNMLLRKGKISEEIVKLILSWRHSLRGVGPIRARGRLQRPLCPQNPIL